MPMRKALQFLGALFHAALDVAAPLRCAACDEHEPHSGPFCAGCTRGARAGVQRASVAGVPVWAAGSYTTPLSHAIQRFKYGARPDLARPLSQLLSPALSMFAPFASELLVPVPLHPRRLAERGYNQAALLTAQIAKASGLPQRPLGLRRIRHTRPQVGRSRADRIATVTGIFEVREPASVRGRRVILVDDVTTTGATLAACVSALEAAGADVRGALLLARAVEAEFDR
jgi:ComF family protein